MDELIKQVAARTGLPEDKARQAADAVVSYIKGKLPPGLAGHLDGLLAGGGQGGGLGDTAKGLLGDLFGKK